MLLHVPALLRRPLLNCPAPGKLSLRTPQLLGCNLAEARKAAAGGRFDVATASGVALGTLAAIEQV